MKKICFDDSLPSFAACVVLALFGCLGIVAWHDNLADLETVAHALPAALLATAAGQPTAPR
jgi:hypothetical protein